MSTTLNLCHTVTAKGHFYFIDGKRVSRDTFVGTKFMRRQECFVTRVEKDAVRNFSVVLLESAVYVPQ